MKSVGKRTKTLALRLKPEELGRLVAEAEELYLPLSAYIRQKLFGGRENKREQGRRGDGQRK